MDTLITMAIIFSLISFIFLLILIILNQQTQIKKLKEEIKILRPKSEIDKMVQELQEIKEGKI